MSKDCNVIDQAVACLSNENIKFETISPPYSANLSSRLDQLIQEHINSSLLMEEIKIKNELKTQIDALNIELKEKEKIIQNLKVSLKIRDAEFVRDINIHFEEIYYRYLEIQKQILKTTEEVVTNLHDKYVGLKRERLGNIEPYRGELIDLLRQKRWGLNKLKALIDTAFSPKLGKLNLYNPRKIVIPKKYSKITKLANLPSISIVTPSYNQGFYLEQTIQSVIEQQYPNLQYIIQDGSSTDSTLEVLQKYHDKLTHWESVADSGQSNAINLGFSHADGEIMAYLNSDDLLLPGSLAYIGEYFAQNPDVDVIYGHRILINENGEEIGRWVLPPHEQEILSWVDYVPQETLFWRRSIWEKVDGKIDETFKFAMDWDLILRFRDAGAKFVRLPRFIGAFRVHSQQKTSSQISDVGMKEMHRLRERCHGRYVECNEISEAIQKYLKKHVLFHRLYKLGILRY